MRINNLFNEKKMVFSLEVFPPKVTSSIETIYKMLEELKGVNPDFISVTYGAGGAATSNRTLEIASLIKNKYNMEPVAHLTCIDAKEDEIKEILRNLKNEGIENILALRGDGNPDTAGRSNDFKYASDLIQFIKKTDDFNISGACYPEGHIDCRNLDKDIENLKIKNDLLDKEKRLLYSIEENKQLQKRLSDEQTKARKVQKEYENLLAEQKVKTQSQSKPIVPKQEVSSVNRSKIGRAHV